MFVTAKRDTFIHSMNNPEIGYSIPEGKWLFHITSPNETKYLQLGEIAVWERGLDGVCYTYEGDWELDDK
jgi:hypothetical protein